MNNTLFVLVSSVLVRGLWGEGKVNEAVEAVRDMEQRGVVGTSSVYYELACCLCSIGRWEDAILEVNLFDCGGWICCGRFLVSYLWCDFCDVSGCYSHKCYCRKLLLEIFRN